MKKILAIMLSVAMIISVMSSTVAFAATAAVSSEPKVTVAATNVMTHPSNGLTYAVFTATLSSNDTYDFKAETDPFFGTTTLNGKGLANYQLLLKFDSTMFDATKSLVNTGTVGGSGQYNSATGMMSHAWSASSDSATLVPSGAMTTFMMALNDEYKSYTVDQINNTKFVTEEGWCSLRVKAYSNNTETENTGYDNQGKLDYELKVVYPEAKIEPVAPVVTAVTIDPTTATVNGGESTTFTATVEGTDGNDDKGEVVALDKSVTWTATAGTIVGGVFTAPAATDAEQTITVTATSVADTSKSASAIVTVPKAVPADKDPVVESVTVTPETATVEGGATETFTAVVAGQTGLKGGVEVAVPQDVEWTATAGTIVDGVFTAPAATDAEQTITITATAKGTSVSGTATVTVPAKVVVVTTTVTVTDAKATQSSAFKNQNTMYWGVTISNGLKGDVTAQLEAEDEQSKVTTLDFSEVTINGDAVFGVYTKVAAKRLDKAIKLVITDVASGVVGKSSAASYNSLLK